MNLSPARTVKTREAFREALIRERAVCDRKVQEFSLLAFEVQTSTDSQPFRKLVHVLSERIRQTDEAGWLDQKYLGVLLPDTSSSGARTLARDICHRSGAARAGVVRPWRAGRDVGGAPDLPDGRVEPREPLDQDGAARYRPETLVDTRVPGFLVLRASSVQGRESVQKDDDIFGHGDTKTRRRARFSYRARRGAAQRRARRAHRTRTTTGPWLGRSFAVGAPHGSACAAGRPRRVPLCLGVSVACPNQYVGVITRFCTKYAEQRTKDVAFVRTF